MLNYPLTTEELYQIFLQHPSVQTDTRKLKLDDIFFALKGPNFNANNFAEQAIKTGAAYAVVDEDVNSNHARIIRVVDVLTSLQQLAKHHREQFNIPFIAITGSNGKTTTKELVHAVLSEHFKACTTQGNLNNHIGIPITLLSIEKDAEIAVIEMGANHQKEIEGYCIYTQPTHGIITNCGKAHLEGFGGEDGVRKGKGELFEYLHLHKGTAFAFKDYDYLQEMSKGIQNTIWYGTTDGMVTGKAIKSELFLHVEITKGITFSYLKTNLVGDYNLPNVLGAIAVGKHFDVPDEKIKSAIENYIPSNSRSQLLEIGTNKIILDAYNANPTSMKAAIENFIKLDSGNKVLMLGGMMELGAESIAEHANIVELIAKSKFEQVVLVGGDFKDISQNYNFFNNATEAREWFKQQHFENKYILVKGSRTIQMEKVLEDVYNT